MKTRWEYRVVSYPRGINNLFVFKHIEFDDRGKMRRVQSVNVGGDNVNELKTLIIALVKAFDKPILHESDLENLKTLPSI